jgi:biopolymer transport protein ExbB
MLTRIFREKAMLSTNLQRSRFALLMVFCLAGFMLSSNMPGLAPVAHAQDEAAPPAAAKKAGPAKSHNPIEVFTHVIYSVGIGFGFVFLIVSIALVTLMVLLLMELRMGVAVPPAFVEEFTELVNKRRFKEAFELAQEDPSYLARTLHTGMGRLQYGIDDAREAAFNMVDSLRAGKENLINYLATIGTLGPLLGLVGTVFGMILSFMTLANSTGGLNAQAIAGDISHALSVTMVGIGLSVPAIFAHTFFRNRLIRLSHDIGNVADDLLTQMYHNSKKAGSTSAADVDVRATTGAKK